MYFELIRFKIQGPYSREANGSCSGNGPSPELLGDEMLVKGSLSEN